jgi:hypothetical protein
VVERDEDETRAPISAPVVEARLSEHREGAVPDGEAASQQHPAGHASPAEPAAGGLELAAHFAQRVTPRKLHMMQMNVPQPSQG